MLSLLLRFMRHIECFQALYYISLLSRRISAPLTLSTLRGLAFFSVDLRDSFYLTLLRRIFVVQIKVLDTRNCFTINCKKLRRNYVAEEELVFQTVAPIKARLNDYTDRNIRFTYCNNNELSAVTSRRMLRFSNSACSIRLS